MEFTIFITILIFFFSAKSPKHRKTTKKSDKILIILFVSCFLFHLQGLIRSIQNLKCLLFLLNIKLQEPTLANALSTGQFLASLSLSNFLDKVYWIIFSCNTSFEGKSAKIIICLPLKLWVKTIDAQMLFRSIFFKMHFKKFITAKTAKMAFLQGWASVLSQRRHHSCILLRSL